MNEKWVYLGARLGAVHDGVAFVQREGVVESIQALCLMLVSAVDDPAVSLHCTSVERQRTRGLLNHAMLAGCWGSPLLLEPDFYVSTDLHEHGRSQVFVGTPPVAGTGGRTTGAQDALIQTIQLLSAQHRENTTQYTAAHTPYLSSTDW